MKQSEPLIRPATSADLPAMLEVYAAARVFMAANGNPHQWGDEGYPAKALLEEDIAQGRSYVAEGEDGAVHGAFMFAPGPDPTYGYIEDGAWLSDEPYGVIHRIASDGTLHGLLGAAVEFCEKLCPVIRIDTHHDNTVMQKAIAKAGFQRCGIIYLENGDPRIAYQRPDQAKLERREMLILLGKMAAVCAAILILFKVIFGLSVTIGASMTPTLVDGDITICTRVGYTLQRGDIIIFELPKEHKSLVKRVIAVAGDTVDVRAEEAAVYVNGVKLDEALAPEGYLGSLTTYQGNMTYPVTVGEGEVFVLGDNRVVSRDSRYTSVGLVPTKNVEGKILTKLFRVPEPLRLWNKK